MVDVEDTGRTDLGLLQQLNGQYGAEHCHVQQNTATQKFVSFGLDCRTQMIL